MAYVLFTESELAALLQVDAVPVDQYELVLGLVTGLIEDRIGPVGSTTSTITLPVGASGRVDLPMAVVRSVDAVLSDGEAVEFVWRKPYPTLYVRACGSVDVTVTHGHDVVPAAVKAVALSAAARAVSNPQGVVSESVDDYSATYRAAGEEAGSSLVLTSAELEALGSGSAYVTG